MVYGSLRAAAGGKEGVKGGRGKGRQNEMLELFASFVQINFMTAG